MYCARCCAVDLQPDMPDDYLGPFITGPDGQQLLGTVTVGFST
jgi:hypothetical protein